MKKVVLFLFLSPSSLLAATTYYVSPSGSNSFTCLQATSILTPRQTMNSGLQCLIGGDTLIARAGVYAERIDTDAGSNVPSGSSGNPTIIKNASGETVWLQPSGGCGTCLGVPGNSLTNKSFVTIDGINLDFINIIPLSASGFPDNGSADGWKLNDPISNVVITNAEIKNGSIGVLGTCTSCTYSNLNIHDLVDWVSGQNGSQGHVGYGFYTCDKASTFDNNYIHDVDGNGILAYTQGVTPCYGYTVRNNRVSNIGRVPFGFGGIYLCCNGSAGLHQVYNNILDNIASPNTAAATLGNGPIFIANNTFYANATAIGISDTSTIQNNIFYNNATNINPTGSNTCNSNLGTTSGGCSGNLNTDPLFVNAAIGDFRLSSAISPAVGTASNLTSSCSGCTVDKAGNPRPPLPTPWDIGAYQLVSPLPVPVLAMNSFRRSR